MLGANPLASNGSLMTAPDMRGRLRGAARARRQARRGRPAPHAAPPRRPTSTTRSGPAPTRCCCSRSCTCCSPRTSSRPAASPSSPTGSTRSRELAQPFTPEAVAPVDRDRRRARSAGWRASWPPPSRPPSTAGSARRRRSSARSPPGWSTCSTSSPATSTGRAARCSRAPPPGQRNSSGEPGRGRGAQHRPLALARARAARELRRAAGRGARRGDRDAGRGPGPRADHARRQPGALDAELRPDRARRSESLDLYVAIDIYVNETTRHADVILPAPSPLERSPLRPRASTSCRVRNVANYSPPVLPPDPGVPDEWETLLRLAAHRRRPARARRRRAARPARRRRAAAARGRRAALARARARRRRAAGRARAAPRARAAARHPAALRPVRRRLRRRPDGSTLADLEAAPHGIDLGPLEPRLPERAAHAERADRARARRRSSPTSRACARRSARDARRRRARAGRPPPAALEQLLDAQPRAAGQRPGALHAARAPGRRRRGSGSPTASRRACAAAPARCEATVEVTDAVMPGVVSLPHGWGHDAPGARLGVAGEHAGRQRRTCSPTRRSSTRSRATRC